MNDFSVCPNCFTVNCEDDYLIPDDEGEWFDCGCGERISISWWRLRLYDPTLPLVPSIGTKYELKARIFTPHDIKILETTFEDTLEDIYKDIPVRERQPFVAKAIATA